MSKQERLLGERKQRPITYRDEAGQEVREYVVTHDTRSEDQLLGLVVAGQLRGTGENRRGSRLPEQGAGMRLPEETGTVLRRTRLIWTTTHEMGGAAP